ncbi:hypothetical protein VOLCADRAFT_105432 [Volvox carteri f. nagariensis]|uniref:Transmembrane protein n=1 Tax=Volvox carteri f. nagariensis TaxID=3068 RepID=D8U0R9_VOLCA|nr:uncharacterized protein VOLCADRAFT_105432 [Volvox carteri f. nagariensis]EFJ46686.1 hypothetical protein VOLCADRAFT_105432 [Volvox carteri f. nagariensis]|eukprot:XP_002952215.1 hypothetical protein VOLCADRAFT_105432 [Volvox carteri f. nagariensis]
MGKIKELCGESTRCSDALSYCWWGISFCAVLSVVILVLAALRKTVLWTSTLQAFCAACASVSMSNAASIYMTKVQLEEQINDSWYDGYARERRIPVDVSFAGFILQSIGLLALIIALGVVNSVQVRRLMNVNPTVPTTNQLQ